MRRGTSVPCSPRSRTSKPARAFRATASPTKFAIEPPDTSNPCVPAGSPSSSTSHAITRFSTCAAASSNSATWGFIPEASMSASMASGVPVPMTQPQNRG